MAFVLAELRKFLGERVTPIIATDYVSTNDAMMVLSFESTEGKDQYKHRSVKSQAPASSRAYGNSGTVNNSTIASVVEILYGVSDKAEFDVRDFRAAPESVAAMSYIDAQLSNAFNNVAEKIVYNVINGDHAAHADEPNGLIVRATGGVNDLTPAAPVDISGNAPDKEAFIRLIVKMSGRLGAVPVGGYKVAFMHSDVISVLPVDLVKLSYTEQLADFNRQYKQYGDLLLVDAGYYNRAHNLTPAAVTGISKVVFAKFGPSDVVIPTFYSEVIAMTDKVAKDAFISEIGLDAMVGVAVINERSIGIIGNIKIV